MGAHWIGTAKAVEVRQLRVADVLRRAHRFERGAGPFYPTDHEQYLLSRRGAARRQA
jgi:hypothetical protein